MLLFCDAALISRSGEIVTHTPLLVPGAVSSFRNTALRVESGVRRVTLDPHPARFCRFAMVSAQCAAKGCCDVHRDASKWEISREKVGDGRCLIV